MIGPIDGIGREAIQSSNIKAAGYDPATQTLAIEFKSGDVFHYAPASSDLALAFYSADSKGKYYSANIRGKLQGRLMTGPCNGCGARGIVGDPCLECGGNFVERKRTTRRPDESDRHYE